MIAARHQVTLIDQLLVHHLRALVLVEQETALFYRLQIALALLPVLLALLVEAALVTSSGQSLFTLPWLVLRDDFLQR